MKTIYILWLRQVKRFLRSKSRIFGALAQPLLFLVSLSFGFGPIFAKAGEGNYLEFLTPGIIGMSIIFTAIFSGMEIIWDRQFGFLKETLVAPVSRINIMLGRTLGSATVAAGQGVVVFLISLLAGFRPVNWWLFPVILLTMMLIAMLFTALGTMIASFMKDVHGFQLIINFMVMPLFFLSGAIFPLQGLPKSITIVARMDPLAYGVDAMRYLMINVSQFGFAMDIGILAAITCIFLALGSYSFSKIQI